NLPSSHLLGGRFPSDIVSFSLYPMGDAEDIPPPSRKRAAGRELSRENPGLDDEDEACDLETGTFKSASADVLATRKIVKVRRHQTSSAPSSNPFAGIRLVPSVGSSSAASEATNEAETEKIVSEDVNKETDKAEDGNGKKKSGTVNEGSKPELSDDKATKEDKTENEDSKETNGATAEDDAKKDNDNGDIEKGAEAGSLSSFHQLSSSKNAFTGLSGTGFSSSTFSFGLIPKEGSLLGPGTGCSSSSFFGLKTDQPSSFNLSNNGNASLFGTPGLLLVLRAREVDLYPCRRFMLRQVKRMRSLFLQLILCCLNLLKDVGRREGRVNSRLILNACLYSDMKLANMDKRGITFACMNSASEGKDTLSTFALKFKDASIVEEFRESVTEYKGKTAAVLKTPENSP
ncbi:hypothetical protein C3L33_00284, partial [Rhododendron williamsianum]